MPELIATSLQCDYGIGNTVDTDVSIPWDVNEKLDLHVSLPITKGELIDIGLTLNYREGLSIIKSIGTDFKYDFFEQFNTSITGIRLGTHSIDVITNLPYDFFEKFNTSILGIKAGTHSIDISGNLSFQMVDIQGSKVDPFREFRYLPTSDFQIDSELIGFTSDFIQPIDLTKVVSRLSPIESTVSLPWKLSTPIDIFKEIKWGYGLNNFLVGGVVRTIYDVDEDAINPPVDPPAVGGVIRVVNTVNVVKLPERTPIDFVDFTLATDLDSIAWVVNFTIGSQASLDLLKPTGLTTIEVEININGELFVCFIGRTKTLLSTGSGGGIKKAWKCTGWSATKRLSYPYSPKRSFTETSSSTPAGLLNDELLGSGFTGTWSSVSWTIPANVFSYYEKSPLAAISELMESVGAVLIPHPETKTLTIEPYYPVSPWDWDITSPDFTLNETDFYTMDTEWLPKESPDSIYVYGEETGGVAVQAVRIGTAGLLPLPTIVNKYITDNVAGGERGRIEIAKNAFKEIIPVTTYVDAVDGIIKPQSLLQITPLSGATWKGMVVGTSIAIKRVGTAVVQSLQIERHYD
jgi:hypothetical protein